MNLKKVGQRRNALFPSVKDFCRFCGCSFKVRYGENFFQPSKQKGLINIALAEQCEDIGLTLKQCEGKSDRVSPERSPVNKKVPVKKYCNLCGSKTEKEERTKSLETSERGE